MNALIPIGVALQPLTSLIEAAPETLMTWAPIALAVLFGVGLVGTVVVVALAVVLSKARKPAEA